jgi:hypothetical protein
MVNGIWNDPALSNEAKALFKRKYPTVALPDYDLQQQVDERFAKEKKERDDAAKKKQDAEQDEDWRSKRKATQEKFGFTDDGMKDLEKFMSERGVGDYEVAAEYHASRNPSPSREHGGHGMPWGFQRNDQFKEIAKDPEEWARKEILQAARTEQERERQLR